jgi:2-keto-4-pentenoate hydratase/2-oxohepta-3-ene-1,7-dioic acid hydratase in catechol pathway
MKWCRFQIGDRVSYGLVEDDEIVEVDGNPFAEHRVGRGRHRLGAVKLLAPIVPRALYAAGPNYRGHLEGMAKRRGEAPRYPARPEPKLRSVNAIIGTEDDIVVPKESTGAVQPEGQLAVVIGKKARNVSRDEALDCVLGYSIGNDVSQREWQKTDRTLGWQGRCERSCVPRTSSGRSQAVRPTSGDGGFRRRRRRSSRQSWSATFRSTIRRSPSRRSPS